MSETTYKRIGSTKRQYCIEGISQNEGITANWNVFIPKATSDETIIKLGETLAEFIDEVNDVPEGYLNAIIKESFPDSGIEPWWFFTKETTPDGAVIENAESYGHSGSIGGPEGPSDSLYDNLVIRSKGTKIDDKWHGVSWFYGIENDLWEAGLCCQDNKIGMWKVLQPDTEKYVYEWYALDGSSIEPVASAASAEDLIAEQVVQDDLAARGMRFANEDPRYDHRVLWVITKDLMVSKRDDNIENLLIDPDFLTDIERVTPENPSQLDEWSFLWDQKPSSDEPAPGPGM